MTQKNWRTEITKYLTKKRVNPSSFFKVYPTPATLDDSPITDISKVIGPNASPKMLKVLTEAYVS